MVAASEPNAAKVAFVGLGQMGRPMAANVAKSGVDVIVWNRTLARADGLAGVTVASSIAEAVAGADVVVTMLADDAALEAAVFDGGLVDSLRPGGLHISMSTISIELCDLLRETHAASEQRFLAAPVFGRPAAAAAGTLWVVAGGEAAALKSADRIFDAVGRGVFILDTPQEAVLAKLAGNFLIAATIEALGESIVLGEKAGLAPERLFNILQTTLFGSVVVDTYGDAIARRQYQPTLFSLRLGLKDVDLARDAATHYGAPLPLADLVADHLQAALDLGPEDRDWVALVSVLREKAGLRP